MEAPPSEYLCPISMDLMNDPVIGGDGHTYERKAIEEWLQQHSESPLTRVRMDISSLKPNFNLRSSIERWKLSNPSYTIPVITEVQSKQKEFQITKREYEDLIALDIQTPNDQTPNDQTPQVPVLIAILDTSGSMGDGARKETSSEGDDFSRLDLIKHSMKTIAHMLNKSYEKNTSHLTIIEFENTARLIMPKTEMDDVGLQMALKSIDALRPGGSTNIWEGLRLGLDQAKLAIQKNPNANVQILLLTDGEPTPDYLPPLGIERTLKQKLKSLQGKVGISTFGFGYSLDHDMLENICVLGGGSYGFIPDCSMVGTVFVNWCARVLLTLTHHINLRISNTEYSVGDLILGQKQTIVIPKQDMSNIEVIYDNNQLTKITQIDSSTESMIDEYYLYKLKNIVEKIKNKTTFHAIDTADLYKLKEEIGALSNKTPLLESIMKDISSDRDHEGQLTKAVANVDWYTSWGLSYLISYHRALELRHCINFKDKVLQSFAGKEFTDLQDIGVEIFSDIQAPEPSIKKNPFNTFTTSQFGAQATNSISTIQSYIAPNPTIPVRMFSMGRFMDPNGVCFTGDCVCLMENSRLKVVRDLKKGDRVWGGHRILAVTFTPVQSQYDMIVFDTGLKITAWHPVRDQKTGEWVFPNSLAYRKRSYVDGLYNLVLESGHEVEINGYSVCTLGHGFTDNEVISHSYFGTQAVIRDLKKKNGWMKGFITLDPTNIIRDAETNCIVGI
jgi:Mg-chelatase subunit ChlD